MGVDAQEVRKSSYGWSPVYATENLGVMSVGFMLNSKNDAIVWRGPRKNGLIKQFLTDVYWGDLDMLLVDAPPGTSDEHLSITTYLKESNVDGAIIVTTPQEVSLLDVRKEISFCNKVGLPILGVVENMAGFTCPSCNCNTEIFAPSSGGARAMCQEMNVRFLGSIPLDPHLMRSCEEGKVCCLHARSMFIDIYSSLFTLFSIPHSLFLRISISPQSYCGNYPTAPAVSAFKNVVSNLFNTTAPLQQTASTTGLSEALKGTAASNMSD